MGLLTGSMERAKVESGRICGWLVRSWRTRLLGRASFAAGHFAGFPLAVGDVAEGGVEGAVAAVAGLDTHGAGEAVHEGHGLPVGAVALKAKGDEAGFEAADFFAEAKGIGGFALEFLGGDVEEALAGGQGAPGVAEMQDAVVDLFETEGHGGGWGV